MLVMVNGTHLYSWLSTEETIISENRIISVNCAYCENPGWRAKKNQQQSKKKKHALVSPGEEKLRTAWVEWSV